MAGGSDSVIGGARPVPRFLHRLLHVLCTVDSVSRGGAVRGARLSWPAALGVRAGSSEDEASAAAFGTSWGGRADTSRPGGFSRCRGHAWQVEQAIRSPDGRLERPASPLGVSASRSVASSQGLALSLTPDRLSRGTGACGRARRPLWRYSCVHGTVLAAGTPHRGWAGVVGWHEYRWSCVGGGR